MAFNITPQELRDRGRDAHSRKIEEAKAKVEEFLTYVAEKGERLAVLSTKRYSPLGLEALKAELEESGFETRTHGRNLEVRW